MKSKEITDIIEKIIIKSIFDSLYKDNKITKNEYKKLLNELSSSIA